MLRALIPLAWIGGICAWITPVQAQTFGINRFSNPALNLGRITSATTGDTVFRIASSTGAITRVSGSGKTIGSPSGNVLVTLTCTDKGKAIDCASTRVLVEISAGGSAGRAKNLTNFNVTAGSAVMSSPKSANLLSFTVEPIGSGGTKTFYLGADFTVAGDDSGLSTGTATAAFNVTVSKLDRTASVAASGTMEAQVLKPLSVSSIAGMTFGRIVKPASGSGLVSIDPVKDNRTVQGGQGLSSPTPRAAEFAVNGEGGQTFSVSVPPTFEMKTSGATIAVTTSHTAAGSERLSSAGASSFKVGGSFPITQDTRPGNYTGSFTVSVQYN